MSHPALLRRMLRSAPPLVTDLRPWTDRKEATQLRAERTEVQGALRRR
jgi:type IV secretion system protein VirD4